MRRVLFAVVALTSLVWAAGDLSAPALLLHESLHHHSGHVLAEDLASAVHGHLHHGTPDHDHQLTTLPTLVRAVHGGPWSLAAAEDGTALPPGVEGLPATIRVDAARTRHGPPRHLMHCVLLT